MEGDDESVMGKLSNNYRQIMKIWKKDGTEMECDNGFTRLENR